MLISEKLLHLLKKAKKRAPGLTFQVCTVQPARALYRMAYLLALTE